MARSHRLPARARRLIAVAFVAVLVGCGDTGDEPAGETTPPGGVDAATATIDDAEPAPEPEGEGDGLYPDVVDVRATVAADGTWRFDVTLSSPYDTPERYADAWRVLAPDGTELGVRVLAHDHQNEQPFTRSLSGVVIPDDVTTVTVEGRDQRNGWGGDTITFELP